MVLKKSKTLLVSYDPREEERIQISLNPIEGRDIIY